MKAKEVEIGFLVPPEKSQEIDILKIKKLMKKKKYALEQIIDSTHIFFKERVNIPDQIHIGKKGDFSRFTSFYADLQIEKAVQDGFDIWRSTKTLRSLLTNEKALPVQGNTITVILIGQTSIDYLSELANGIWKGFTDSYYGVETTQSIGIHCIIMQMHFKGSPLSDSDLYHRIPVIEEKYNKNVLLHRIDNELDLPEDNLGFNFKDATISKSALAKILLGIQRQKYGKIE